MGGTLLHFPTLLPPEARTSICHLSFPSAHSCVFPGRAAFHDNRLMISRLPVSLPELGTAWHAELHLGFARSGERTVLRENRHRGPLRVQKALYPEGDAVCQAIVLHPPSGIAGGDHLAISATVETGAHAQLTTPGAGKWYRSGGTEASQVISLSVLCAFPELPAQAAALLDACRTTKPADVAAHAFSVLPGIFVARYLGDSSEAARLRVAKLWKILRPACCGRPAILPRNWHTRGVLMECWTWGFGLSSEP
jgi:hypothetical protein